MTWAVTDTEEFFEAELAEFARQLAGGHSVPRLG
jgi:hypothetical protein